MNRIYIQSVLLAVIVVSVAEGCFPVHRHRQPLPPPHYYHCVNCAFDYDDDNWHSHELHYHHNHHLVKRAVGSKSISEDLKGKIENENQLDQDDLKAFESYSEETTNLNRPEKLPDADATRIKVNAKESQYGYSSTRKRMQRLKSHSWSGQGRGPFSHKRRHEYNLKSRRNNNKAVHTDQSILLPPDLI